MTQTRYAMVIDLRLCVGCAACDIACKSENNVPDGFHWANHIIETSGKFPNVRYRHIPTLCNHCGNAPCVANCPTTAMHKSDTGLTLHDSDKCIGCSTCQLSCPYSVIYRNRKEPHQPTAKESTPLIQGCTSTKAEVAEITGEPIPYFNPTGSETCASLRCKGVVEKCVFCEHRLAKGLLPWCVESCPAGARIFGDLNDPESPPSLALAKHAPRVLQEEKGTQPHVFYIREF